jgi:hypothetical protein
MGPLPSRFPSWRVSRREQSLRHSHTAVALLNARQLTGLALERRPVRGVMGEVVNRIWRRCQRVAADSPLV